MPATPVRTAHTATALPAVEELPLQPGTQIRQYELIRELGRGGMGVVYAARDTRLGRRVAIKFLHDAARTVAERFLIEARATAQCTHENIVVIHEVDEHDGTPYMVLEFLEGRSLRDVIAEEAPLSPARAIELALPIARALTRAHELGIVHRDLKPDNVFVTRTGQVKVLDFGIAKALGEAGAPDSGVRAELAGDVSLTHELGIVGTPAYMSPEQMGVGEVDHRTDLWSLGIILFEMLAGRHPLESASLQDLINNAASEEPMPGIAGVVPELAPELARLVDRCLRKPAAERIPDARALVAALEQLLPGRLGRTLAPDECPYPGLVAFQEGDAHRFFGRARDVERVIVRLREQPMLAIVGPSGAGKSSFVRAGLVPALKTSGDRWDVLACRPGRQPVAELAAIALQLAGIDPAISRAEHERLCVQLRDEPGRFAALLRQRARHVQGRLLVFVDQFEELYTLGASAEERRAFTAALAGVADDSASPLRVLISMRSDLIDRIAEDPRFADELARGLTLLAAPDRDGLRDALVLPAEMAGYQFESAAMVGEMLDALAGTPGALPLLQFTGAKLWDARDRARRRLTLAAYHAIGGISGALASHADEVLAQLAAPARQLAKRVFKNLVTPERTRAVVERAELAELAPDPDEVGRVVDQLVAARLLVVHARGDAGTDQTGAVELVHESLIDRWPTLRRWLDEDQEDAAFLAQLAAAAKQWDARGRPPGLLWRGEMMEEARRWDAQRTRPLPARDRAFLDALLALARRGRRIRRVATIAAFVVLGSFAGVVSVYYLRARAAETALQQKVDEVAESERHAREMEAEAREALRRFQQAEVERAAARRDAHTASQLADRSRAELEAQYLVLQDALAEATRARKQAELARRQAETAAAKARRATAEKERALAVERARVRVLEEEKRKLSTRLK